jgi:hypothetical protein
MEVPLLTRKITRKKLDEFIKNEKSEELTLDIGTIPGDQCRPNLPNKINIYNKTFFR